MKQVLNKESPFETRPALPDFKTALEGGCKTGNNSSESTH